MKKNKKTICISLKKAYIIGLIIAFIFAIIGSFAGAYMMIDAGLGNGKFDVFGLAKILIPLLFIVFVMIIFLFIVICQNQNDKK